MKIIHTADWHLGRILNGKQLLDDQKYVLTKFINHMEKEKPDVIVIAGDLYDTSYPSKETMSLLENTIAELNIRLQIPVIMISGNHDGKERLNYGSSWFEHNHLFIRTKLKDIHKPIEINGVQFFALPFATISEVQHFFEDKEINTHQQALNRCIEYMSQNIDENKVSILIGHLTIKGGKTSDSERPLTIGTVESVERQSFDQFEYVMLGHLHHPFSVNEKNIKYSGSLLQYSFSEVNQAKGYRIVNIDEVNHVEDTFKSIEPLRELEVIDGDYDDVIEERVSVKNKDNYFHFKLTNMSHINDPMMKLKQIYPNTLALTNHTFEHIEEFNNVEIKKQDDQSIIKSFYESMTKEEISETQSNKIAEILNNIMRKEV